MIRLLGVLCFRMLFGGLASVRFGRFSPPGSPPPTFFFCLVVEEECKTSRDERLDSRATGKNVSFGPGMLQEEAMEDERRRARNAMEAGRKQAKR